MKHEPTGHAQRGRVLPVDVLRRIIRLLKEKKPKAEIARLTAVSRKTVQRTAARLEENRLESLALQLKTGSGSGYACSELPQADI